MITNSLKSVSSSNHIREIIVSFMRISSKCQIQSRKSDSFNCVIWGLTKTQLILILIIKMIFKNCIWAKHSSCTSHINLVILYNTNMIWIYSNFQLSLNIVSNNIISSNCICIYCLLTHFWCFPHEIESSCI